MQSMDQSAVSSAIWQGQHGRLELTQGIVSKQPKTSADAAALTREAEVLRRLQGLLPLEIPRPLDGPGLCYRCLDGKPLNRELFQSLSAHLRSDIAAQLGGFLSAMHQLPPALFDGVALPEAESERYWQEFYSKVSALLFPHFRADAVEPVRWSFVRFLNHHSSAAWTPVVLHGDFGPTNLLYEEQTGAVAVIDFGAVRLGDPAMDIAALMGTRGYGQSFVRSLTPYYAATPRLLERARFYAQTFALEQAIWGLEHNDKEAYEDGMHAYI